MARNSQLPVNVFLLEMVFQAERENLAYLNIANETTFLAS